MIVGATIEKNISFTTIFILFKLTTMGCDHSKNDGRTAGDNRRLNLIQQKKEEVI